ncbi:MAG TPA: FAD-dependent monooxygenase [Bacteroidia bacterium]|nr:FAD-dependent monooxygenase [Bacteroidia bacterium]HNU34293.1 FAD-dependent monooxygenase [Bacteroidia bacterium]
MKQSELFLLPEEAANELEIKKQIGLKIGFADFTFRVLKRSIDARSKQVKIRLLVEVLEKGEVFTPLFEERKFQNVSTKKEVHIIGAGPAGLFAALRLVELGYKPVIIERGKDVRMRRRDLAALNKDKVVNPNSNYCFGEGGAGTYSDGKLYTRSGKRGNIQRILNTFIEFGASDEIGVDAHPHIGTNKLPGIISSMRERIIECGGEVLFNSRLKDIFYNTSGITAVEIEDVQTNNPARINTSALILATGHSARDIFELLYNRKILIEGKPFALGVRVEHRQNIIDSSQYHCEMRSEFLPPASYSLVHQAENNKGVYSFCMCPGGIIAAAATSANEVVVNGWSPSKRNNKFANSGIVVTIDEQDVKKYGTESPLRYLKFQSAIEQLAFVHGGKNLSAPAQRMIDFANNKISTNLPDCSYIPGINSVQLKEVLPSNIITALKSGFRDFGKKIKNYYTNDAVLVGVESRTSSPVKIPRDKETAMHTQVSGLFPCGEGAGYAGGIMSAAIDGEHCANKCVEYLSQRK